MIVNLLKISKIYLIAIVTSGLLFHFMRRYFLEIPLNSYLLVCCSIFIFLLFNSNYLKNKEKFTIVLGCLFLVAFSLKFGISSFIIYSVYILLPLSAFYSGMILCKDDFFLVSLFVFLILYGIVQTYSYFFTNNFMISIDEEIFKFQYTNLKIGFENIIRPFSTFHLFQDYQIFIAMLASYLYIKHEGSRYIQILIVFLFFLQFGINLERTPLGIFLSILLFDALLFKNKIILIFLGLLISVGTIFIISSVDINLLNSNIFLRLFSDPDGSKDLRYTYYWAVPIKNIISSNINIFFGTFDMCPLAICKNYFPPHNSFIAMYMIYGFMTVLLIVLLILFFLFIIFSIREKKIKILLFLLNTLFLQAVIFNSYLYGLSSFGYFFILGAFYKNYGKKLTFKGFCKS